MPMNWDQYKASIDWNNADVTHGFSELAKRMGYGGPVYEAAGQRYMGEGESGPMYAQNYGANSGLDSLLKDYSFESGKDSGGNLAMDVYGPDGQLFSGDNRIGSAPGTGFKIAKTVIPGLVATGFGVGALGALSGGAGAAAGAGGGTGFGLAGAGAGIAPMTAGELAFTALTPEMVAGAGLGTLPGMSGQVAAALSGSGLLGAGGAATASNAGSGFTLPGAGSGIAPAAAVDSLAPMTAAEVASKTLSPSLLGGSGLLDLLKSGGGTAMDFLKNNKAALPMIGGLLGGMGAGGGGSAAPETFGPPQQWNSALQQGLLSTQPKTKMPTGLVGGGNAGAGAWRFMGK